MLPIYHEGQVHIIVMRRHRQNESRGNDMVSRRGGSLIGLYDDYLEIAWLVVSPALAEASGPLPHNNKTILTRKFHWRQQAQLGATSHHTYSYSLFSLRKARSPLRMESKLS